jgi:hypothetical protein
MFPNPGPGHAPPAGGSDLPTTILATQASNLKAYWKCNETSGTTLADSSGNTKTLDLHGSSSTDYNLNQSGQSGASIRFLGVSGYADRGDSVIGGSLGLTTWTFFCLIKGSSNTAGFAVIVVTNFSTHAPWTGIRSSVGTGAAIGGNVRNDDFSYPVSIEGGTGFNDSWHSVAWRRNGNDWSVWVDGSSVATKTQAVSATTVDRTSLGARARDTGPAEIATCYVQHVALWNVALSDSEIVALNAAAFP